jgi:hypothetical protein
MRDGVPWYESTKSANIVKIDAVKSVKPRPWQRQHYGVRRDIHEEMVARAGGTRASRQALDLAIHLLRYEKEHRSQMDRAERDEKQEREELLERRRLRREAHLERERDKAQFMASWMNTGYDTWKKALTRERQRVRRDLRFELSLLDTKKVEEQQRNANASRDQKSGCEWFERNMTRLGIAGPTTDLNTAPRSPESAQVFLKRMEEHVAENTGDPKETYDLMSTLKDKGDRNRNAAFEKARRQRKMRVEQRRAQKELEAHRAEQARLDAFAEKARAQRKLSEAIWEKSLEKEKAQQEVMTRIEKEVDERVAKADEAFETLKSEARERAKDPERLAAIQSIIDEERAKHAARKHAHACEYAKDAVDKFLDMVCVVLKVREDNGRKPMPYPDYRTLKEVYVSAEPYFVDDDPGPPPPGDASASARKAVVERLAFEEGSGDWSWGISHEERFGRDSRDPVTLATETLSLLVGDDPPSLRPACPEVPSTKRMCVLGPSSELVADGASVMGLVTCTPVIAVTAALRRAEAAAAAREEAAEALDAAVEGDDLAVLEKALEQAREKGVEDLSVGEARRAELKEIEAAAAPAPAEGEGDEAEATEAEEEAEPEEPPPPPPLQARGEALLQLPEAAVNYESEEEEPEEEEAPEEEQPADEEEGGDELVAEPEPEEEEDPAVVEARLQAKKARAFERKVKALADAAPDALLAETVAAFCNEAAEQGRGFCVGGYPRTLAQAELLEQAFHPEAEDEPLPTWDGLITIKREPADDDAAAPAPAPQEGDAEAEEAQQAAEAAEAERLEAERVVDEIAGTARASVRLTWAPDHLIRLEERVAACVCVLEDYEADTPVEEEEVEDKTLLEKFRARKQISTVLAEAKEANRLEDEISAKAEERVSLLSPAARIWRDKELGTRDVDLDRAKKSIDGWPNDLEVHRDCVAQFCTALDDQRALIEMHCAWARKAFRKTLREHDLRWDALYKTTARQMLKREITSTDRCREVRLELTDDLELALGDIVDDRKASFDEKARVASEKALARANKAVELLGILASRLCAAEATRFASGCMTLDDFEEISAGEAACAAPHDVAKRLGRQLAALEEAVVIADDPEIGDKVRDTARLCTPLASIDGARPQRIRAPHTVQFAAHSVRRLGSVVGRFDRAEQLLRGIVGALRSQLDAMTAARVRVEHERVGRHVRAFRARVKNDEVRAEPLVIGDDDGVDALLMFR